MWIKIEHRRNQAVHTHAQEPGEPEKSFPPRIPEQVMIRMQDVGLSGKRDPIDLDWAAQGCAA